MMSHKLLDCLMMWVAEGGQDRHVQIDLGAPSDPTQERIWCYDYNAMEGATITSVKDLEGLDLQSKKRQSIIEAYKKLTGEDNGVPN